MPYVGDELHHSGELARMSEPGSRVLAITEILSTSWQA